MSLPDLSHQLKTVQQQQQALMNMRTAIAKDIMCELVATETVLDTDLDIDGEEWKEDDPHNIENAKSRLDTYADLAVYGSEALMQQLGLLRKVNKEEEELT